MGASHCTLQEPAFLPWCCSFPSFSLACFFFLNPLTLFFSSPWALVRTEQTPTALRSFILPYRKVGFWVFFLLEDLILQSLQNYIISLYVPKNLEVVKITALINDTIKHCVNNQQVLHAALLGFNPWPMDGLFSKAKITEVLFSQCSVPDSIPVGISCGLGRMKRNYN